MQYSTFAVVTIGCKVNQYEGQALREQFLLAGLAETGPLEDPDILIINTCGVTNNSIADSRQWINRARRANPRTIVIATGCGADIDPGELAEADIVVPQAEKHTVSGRVLGGPVPGFSMDIKIGDFAGHTRAFLKVQDGCARRCAYCAVPIARGKPKSKSFEKTVEEARILADGGFREIVVCGVDLGYYGRETGIKEGITRLLERLLTSVSGVRFRLSSIDVGDVSEELLRLMASSEDICPHLHVPLQSGDDGILERMRRGYTAREFADKINKTKEIIDLPAVTTDCLVGFPGEGEYEFLNTVQACRKCGFSRLHVFRFSPRPGTAAWGLEAAADPADVSGRVRRLIDVGKCLGESYRRSLLGKDLDVVIEKDDQGRSEGIAGRYVRTVVNGAFPRGTRMTVVGTDVKEDFINAEVCR